MASVLVIEDEYTMGIKTASIVEEAGYPFPAQKHPLMQHKRCWAAKRLTSPFLT